MALTRVRVRRVESVSRRAPDLGEDRVAEVFVAHQGHRIDRRPRLDGLHFVPGGIRDIAVAERHPDKPESRRRRRCGCDIDFRRINPHVAPPVALVDAESLGFFLRHLRQRVDQPGGILEGAGTAPATGVAGVDHALADMVRRVDGDVKSDRQLGEDADHVVDGVVVVFVAAMRLDKGVEDDEIDLPALDDFDQPLTEVAGLYPTSLGHCGELGAVGERRDKQVIPKLAAADLVVLAARLDAPPHLVLVIL